MRGRRNMCFACAAMFLLATMIGCYTSSPPSKSQSSNGGSASNGEKSKGTVGTNAKTNGAAAADETWPEYPDVPFVPIMTEADGIAIPRYETGTESLSLTGEIPADVGNEYAKQHPGEPARGDWLIVRLNSEPKTLNIIVETSAVQQYIAEYTNEALARLNPETLEYEPHVAERWVAEDSVKLSADYPGKERRIAVGEGEPAASQDLEYSEPESEDAEPAVVELRTFDGDGQPLGGVWVGVYPQGKILGAPPSGYHYWSDADGLLKVAGIVAGKYTVKVGAELFGKTERLEDGSLRITPETPGNPLSEELKSQEDQSLTLTKDQVADVHEQTIYTYFLRKDVKWSDGTPLTTKDLEFGYAVINNEYVDGESLRIYYQDLISCEPLDAHTVRMRYRQQYFKAFEFTAGLAAYTPPWHVFQTWFQEEGKELTFERLTPEEEEAQNKVSVHGQVFGKFFNTDDRYNLKPLGTGPYVVDKWIRADRVELRRNPNYWLPKRGGYVDRLIFKFIPDDVTALQALKAGEIDFLYRMNSEQYFEDLDPDKTEAKWFFDQGYVKAAWFSPGFSYGGWNLLRPLFQDRRVRIALTLLFDRQEFVDKKLHGEAVLVSGSQYCFGPGYDHEVKPLGYDPETARDLLAEAGWVDTDNDGVLDKDGKKFEFELLMPPGNPTVEDQAALIQKAYKEAGIQMSIARTEWASFIEKVKAKDFDLVRLGWASPIESDPYQIWHSSGAGPEKRGSNHVSFADPLADALMEQVRLTLDKEKRKRIFWSFHRILDREQPYMFLYTPKDFGAYHRRFQGVKWYRVRPGFDLTEWYVPADQQIH